MSSVEARVEQRLGHALDPALSATTTIIVRADRGHYTAQLGLALATRSLTADSCEELADAIAIIVSRLA